MVARMPRAVCHKLNLREVSHGICNLQWAETKDRQTPQMSQATYFCNSACRCNTGSGLGGNYPNLHGVVIMNNKQRIEELRKLEQRLWQTWPRGWVCSSHHSTDGGFSVWKSSWSDGDDIESISFDADIELVNAHPNRTQADIDAAREVLLTWLEAE